MPTGLSTMWMDYIEPYTKSTGVYYCPDGPPGTETAWRGVGTFANDPTFNYGYAMNNWILTPLAYKPGTPCSAHYDWWSPDVTEAKINNPSNDVVLADKGQIFVDHLQPFATSEGYAERDPTTQRGIDNGTKPGWRHQGFANFLFANGHVKPYSSTQMNANAFRTMLGCQPIEVATSCLLT